MTFAFSPEEKAAIHWILRRHKTQDCGRQFRTKELIEILGLEDADWFLDSLVAQGYIEKCGYESNWLEQCWGPLPKVFDLWYELRRSEQAEREEQRRKEEADRNVLNKIVAYAEHHPIVAWIIVIGIVANAALGILNGFTEFVGRFTN